MGTRSNNRQFLFRRIAWRIQALAEGGLSERARRRTLEIANDADIRVRAPNKKALDPETFLKVTARLPKPHDSRLPPPGAWFERNYRGQRIAIRIAGETGSDTGLRFERIKSLEEAIRATERRLDEIARELARLEHEPLDVDHLRRTIREFDDVWATLTVREQEQMVKLLVSKVVYDGVTGKVTISFRSAGAKELCQGKNE